MSHSHTAPCKRTRGAAMPLPASHPTDRIDGTDQTRPGSLIRNSQSAIRPYGRPVGCRNRGETLVEAVSALTLFAVAVVGLISVWVHARQQLETARERATVARVLESSAERGRAAPPAVGAAQLLSYDAAGVPVENESPNGYQAALRAAPLSEAPELLRLTVTVSRLGMSAPVARSETYVEAPAGGAG